MHVQQSALVWHALRQTAFTHTRPPLQSELATQPGFGLWSAWHVPFKQASWAEHWLLLVQPCKQVPLMQTEPATGQSLL